MAMTHLENGLSQRKVAKQGFTLVELLVVIGIVALLVSLLLPALNKVRRSGEMLSCSSNLRQIALAFSLYEKDNRGLWPILLTSGPTYRRTCEGYSLEVLLSKYLGKEIIPSFAASSQKVFGKVFICPASDVTTAPLNGPNSLAYVSDVAASHYREDNCYSGLYYHWLNDTAHAATIPTWTNATVPSWRPRFFKGWQTQVPVQYCSMGRYGIAGVGGVSGPSFHYPNGRPTAFIDGHVAVLHNKLYQNGAQNIMSSNASPNIHAYFETSTTGSNGLPYYGGGNRFALSEY